MIACITLGVYLLLPTREFYWDGVGFAQTIEASHGSPDHLLHPNHLLYNLMGYAVWKAAAAVGMTVRALFILQALNALFAAGSVFLVWQIVAELTRSPRRSTWCAFLFAFAAQWWRYSTDADAYVPAIFFLLVSFRLLLPRQGPRPLAAALAHSAAMLFHQLALFFFPAAIIGLLFRAQSKHRGGASRPGLILVARYGATAFSVTGVSYLLAFLLVRPYIGAQQFWSWVTVHSEDAVFSFEPVISLQFALRGSMQLLLGGRATQVQANIVTVAGALAFGAILVLLVRYFVRSRRPVVDDSSNRDPEGFRFWLSANRPALAWTLTYVVFLFFWQPQNTFYRLFYLPPLIFLLATVPVWRARRIQLLALLAAAVCAWNFTAFIYPHSRAENNAELTFALQRNKDWKQGSAILYSHSHSDLWIISYFNPQATWIAMPSPEVAEVESRRIEGTQKGKPLWLEGTAYDAIAAIPGGQSWLGQHVDPTRSFLYTTSVHRIRYYRVE